ncbi:MAG TPA: AAA family ATPase [Rubricoccaceae bacterium]|nr:AAA family ATPase [Rubricoccaceae bacterium]
MSTDLATLQLIGRVWDPSGDPDWVVHEALAAGVEAAKARLTRRSPRSVLLVGEDGVGKSTLIRELGRRLQGAGWAVFEAGAGDLLAGQSFIGMLEEQLRQLVAALSAPKVLWYVPRFEELAHAGRHQYNPVSVLDQLLPSIERGQIRVVAETSAGAYERLVAAHPRIRTTVDALEVPPLDEPATLALAERWVRHARKEGAPPLVGDADLREALALARQYLPGLALPGALFRLLRLARTEAGADNPASPQPLRLDDLLGTLSRLTGLPRTVLDDREGLDLGALTDYFRRRVLGQEEAVETLVDRVAMVKAGLTDPSRPSGVFLFVGPTGTGKTELAKALAAYLFGSAERMVRLDMSEFQTVDALDRLLGGPAGAEGSALVDHVRKHPFSVLLLDEFEKAAPPVWDLFLQVFDDGRLTDRRGSTVDFRHTIVILTSNLGASVQTTPAIGFGARPAGFEEERVARALGEVFRPEFLNRIDRVVTFRPLSRATMRELLLKELRAVLGRRGFRRRPWAVEWDESALAFLLEAGFTPDLGARPLKRAIERHLLAPLSRAIVAHAVPEGDQFLFIRAGRDELVVEFVDPDADAIPFVEEEAAERSLEAVALDPHGTPEEMGLLQAVFDRLESAVHAPSWEAARAEALARMAESGFWEDPGRFATLGRFEHMDRVEAALTTAASLLDRLRGGGRAGYPPELVGRLAHQLYLLREAVAAHEAAEPLDAFLLVEAAEGEEAARRAGAMYLAWAAARRMRVETLEESGGEAGPYRLLLAVSGFGAYRILQRETGLHVFEQEGESGRTRSTARVRIAPQPLSGAGSVDVLRRQAAEALGAGGRLGIVRRYREGASPLVRDGVRGWRTGRLDRVLGGDFDLVTP